MIVSVDLQAAPARVELLEPHDFKGFKVVVGGDGGADALARALAPLGTVTADGGHAYLRPDAVQALPGAAPEDPEWSRGFAAMVDYAGDHGWTDDVGAVRAHIERAS